MKFKEMPSAEELRRDYSYDPETGIFRRIETGRRVGYYNEKGYVGVGVGGKNYKAHRLAWLYMTGEPPPLYIDHINGVRDDNRWCNLRSATMSQNCFNSRKRQNKNYKSKYKGVSRYYRKWMASIRVNGKTLRLGTFDSELDAHAAYRDAAILVAGEFARA